MLSSSSRLLRVLSLLQTRSHWAGPELAERLAVHPRTLRRDIDRLRQLGYPIHASSGVAGGYAFRAGQSLPPLLLDDEEALAVAIALQIAAAGTVSGVEESSLRALVKLERVMPTRLRRRTGALRSAIVPVQRMGPTIDAGVLATLATACRDQLQVGFSYRDLRGQASVRQVQPHGLVHTGHHWYQDTNNEFMGALATHFLEPKKGPLIGLFGDHWQTIYRDDFDLAALPNVEAVDKGANFRSVPAVVDMLNRLRPSLPQVVDDESAEGEARAFHANSYTGERTDTAHSKQDTPADVTRAYVAALRKQLEAEGWDFSPAVTKVLMLTHAALAAEQGYPSIVEIFKSHQDAISKLDDATLEFLGRVVEPTCAAYKAKKYGQMFDLLGRAGTLNKPSEKQAWADDMKSLDALRERGTVGEVLDLLKKTRRPRMPDNVTRREDEMAAFDPDAGEPEKPSVNRHRRLRDVKYQEVVNLVRFVDGFTPFATQHSVKGAEFENVLVVFGGGWNHYNWPRMLEYMAAGAKPTAAHQKGFNRARNLFYVSVSRPKRRLAVLFTQTMSDKSLEVLNTLFANKVAAVNVP